MLPNVAGIIYQILLMSSLVVSAAVIIGAIIWVILRMIKGKAPCSKIIIIITFVSILVAAAAWLFNFGWIRLFMTFTGIPIIHGMVFFVSNMLFFSKYAKCSDKILKWNMIFSVSYPVSYMFLPDGGDYGGTYFLFGLIHNDNLSPVASFISFAAFIVHVVFFVIQIVEVVKIKKDMSGKAG